ncbi:hypothetical protein CLV35_0097 [Motilibacter peucedani]|uniref:WD40 repeat protein n=1 Tax=Motilibacter peucedani TaxID=598650 RepID=A0A420XVP2_9ACTN|nr:hypothetical protein CLV35_0097 [Motilibacter peucedani]
MLVSAYGRTLRRSKPGLLSPHGRYLAYVEPPDHGVPYVGPVLLHVLDLVTGKTRTISAAQLSSSADVLDWSGDETRLVVFAGGGLRVVDMAHDSLGPLIAGETAALSRSSDLAVQVGAEVDLYRGGALVHRLPVPPGLALARSGWSPGGRRLVLTRPQSDRTGVAAVLDVRSGAVTPLHGGEAVAWRSPSSLVTRTWQGGRPVLAALDTDTGHSSTLAAAPAAAGSIQLAGELLPSAVVDRPDRTPGQRAGVVALLACARQPHRPRAAPRSPAPSAHVRAPAAHTPAAPGDHGVGCAGCADADGRGAAVRLCHRGHRTGRPSAAPRGPPRVRRRSDGDTQPPVGRESPDLLT